MSLAEIYKTKPATTLNDKDKSEICMMWAVIGMMAAGIVGWFGGGAPGAIFGMIAGGIVGGLIAYRVIGRVGRVTKDMQLERE